MQLAMTISEHPARAILRQVVTELGGSQSDAARQLGVSQPLVSGVLSGSIMPGEKLMRALADYTGQPYEEISGKRIARSPRLHAVAQEVAIGNHPGFNNAADQVREILGSVTDPDLLEGALSDARALKLSAPLLKSDTLSVSILIPFVQAFMAIRAGTARPITGPLAKK
mgnify:CR=1 FL=1